MTNTGKLIKASSKNDTKPHLVGETVILSVKWYRIATNTRKLKKKGDEEKKGQARVNIFPRTFTLKGK